MVGEERRRGGGEENKRTGGSSYAATNTQRSLGGEYEEQMFDPLSFSPTSNDSNYNNNNN